MIKPDAVKNGNSDKILERIKKEGFTIVEQKKLLLSKTRAQSFYAEHQGRGFFDELVEFMSSGDIYALILRKNNAIKAWRELMGPTKIEDAKKNAPNSIRALYSKSTTENSAHGSDSYLSATREINFFFPNEITLALIKPTAVKKGYVNEIKKIITEREGFKILNEEKLTLSLEKAQEFYQEHKERGFFKELTTFMSSGPIYAFKLERYNAISKWRTVMGPTNVEVAKKDAPDSIRAKYGTSITENACHGSDSLKAARREVEFFFPTEQTFAMIKPDIIKSNNVENVIRHIHNHGFKIREQQKLKLSKEKAESFYEEHKQRPFFKDLTEFMSSGDIYALKLEGYQAIARWRELMGPTKIEDAKKNAPHSIRALYAQNTTENSVHGSDSPKSAQRELEFFFPIQSTFAMIKPDAVKNGYDYDIMARIEFEGFTIKEKKQLQLTLEKAQEFYAEHKGRPFFDELTKFMSSGKIWILLLQKYNAIQDWRTLMGPTKKEVALVDAPNSIRALYAVDTTQNSSHGSDSVQAATREINFFFNDNKQ